LHPSPAVCTPVQLFFLLVYHTRTGAWFSCSRVAPAVGLCTSMQACAHAFLRTCRVGAWRDRDDRFRRNAYSVALGAGGCRWGDFPMFFPSNYVYLLVYLSVFLLYVPFSPCVCLPACLFIFRSISLHVLCMKTHARTSSFTHALMHAGAVSLSFSSTSRSSISLPTCFYFCLSAYLSILIWMYPCSKYM